MLEKFCSYMKAKRSLMVLLVFILSLNACLDKDVSNLYFYKDQFICEGEVAKKVHQLTICFDNKRYRSVIFKPIAGTEVKIITRTMNYIAKQNMERVKMINQIREEEVIILNQLLSNNSQ